MVGLQQHLFSPGRLLGDAEEAAAWQGPYVFEGRDRLLESGAGLDLGTNQVSPPHFPILYTFVLGNWNFWETS